MENSVGKLGPMVPSYKSAPLTFQQEAAWNALAGKESRYIVFALRLTGGLEVDALRLSIDRVVERHESLRTRMVIVAGEPRQVVAPEKTSELVVVDISGSQTEGVHSVAKSFIEKRYGTGVRLDQGPLFSATLLRLGRDEHALALAIDHSVSDGFSMHILFRELWLSYNQFAANGPSCLSCKPPQYGDYATWQRSTFLKKKSENEEYWKIRLAGAAPVRLPADVVLEDVRPFSAAEMRLSFGDGLSRNLAGLARNERTTLFLVVLSIFVTHLARWCQQRDVVLWTVHTGRMLPDHVNVIGCCATGLLLRIVLSGHERFADVLKIVADEYGKAQEHIEFGQIVGRMPELQQTVGISWLPAEYCTAFENCGIFGIQIFRFARLGDPAGVPIPGQVGRTVPLGIEPFPVDINVVDGEYQDDSLGFLFSHSSKGIFGHGHYRADLFTAETMHRFSEEFQRTAEHVVRNPRVPLMLAGTKS